jgi:hypothetical protein
MFQTCSDPVLRVWEAVRLLACDPYLGHTELVRGVLYDERADALTDVCHASGQATSSVAHAI